MPILVASSATNIISIGEVLMADRASRPMLTALRKPSATTHTPIVTANPMAKHCAIVRDSFLSSQKHLQGLPGYLSPLYLREQLPHLPGCRNIRNRSSSVRRYHRRLLSKKHSLARPDRPVALKLKK